MPKSHYSAPKRPVRAIIDKHAKANAGLGYTLWRYFREQGVNTANLARIFNKHWKTIRDWEIRDDMENGAPVRALKRSKV